MQGWRGVTSSQSEKKRHRTASSSELFANVHVIILTVRNQKI